MQNQKPRRIFHHLIPNVIPQLIVICTMDLGSTILTEATLSFLGLGVKFPFASWGNIGAGVAAGTVSSDLFGPLPARSRNLSQPVASRITHGVFFSSFWRGIGGFGFQHR